MNKLIKNMTISGLGIVALSLIGGCTLSTEETTKSYTPEPPAPVYVAPPEVTVVPAPAPVYPDTSSTTVEKKTHYHNYDYYPNGAEDQSQSTYHSESTTVGP